MPPKSKRDWQRAPHRVYEPGKRHMELIPSVSRSSGLEKDGDALRDLKVQQEYRQFIQEKIEDYWKRYPRGKVSDEHKQRDEVQGNLLILFRKLREGIMSSKRRDAFALEVYETSLYLSIIFNNPAQATSVISHLIPTLYQPVSDSSSHQAEAVLLSLLHFLVAGYPSHGRYLEHLHALPQGFFPAEHPMRMWLRDLTRTIRLRNYARLDQLTSREACTRLFATQGIADDAQTPSSRADLVLHALFTVIDALRAKTRDTIWIVLRSAYRELSLPHTDPAPTRGWLHRSLVLEPVAQESHDDADRLVDLWVAGKHTLGDLRQKEGPEGRWIVAKPKG